jgi:hypothetical protein
MALFSTAPMLDAALSWRSRIHWEAKCWFVSVLRLLMRSEALSVSNGEQNADSPARCCADA